MDEWSQLVLDSIRRIVRGLRVSSRRSERELDISSAQLFVLQKLAESIMPLSLTQLSRKTLTDISSVSVVAAKLEARGLVNRQYSAQDKRRINLKLTAKGKRMTQKSLKTAQQRLFEGLNAMKTSDRKQLGKLLSIWLVESGLDESSPSMFFEDNGGESR